MTVAVMSDPYLDDVAAAVVDDGVPGVVLLAANGDDVGVAVAGHHDVERSRPMARDSLFRVASVTKPIMAALAMALVDDGVVALDDPVREWLPELATPKVLREPFGPLDEVVPAQHPITVRHLLTLRGGHGLTGDFGSPATAQLLERLHQGPPAPQSWPSPDAWIGELADLPLLHEPGRGWTYNTGIDLLGVLLSRATGRSLGDVLADRLLEPLGMVDTSFWVSDDHVDRLPSLYGVDEDGGLDLLDPPDGQWAAPPPFASGSGGLVTSADDLHRFARLFLDAGQVDGRRVLSADSVDAITADHVGQHHRGPGGDTFLDGQGWGLGGGVDTDPQHPWQRRGRYGWVGGTGTSWYVHRRRRTVQVFLTQVMLGGPTSIEHMQSFWSATTAP